jgi:hypothetical protein
MGTEQIEQSGRALCFDLNQLFIRFIRTTLPTLHIRRAVTPTTFAFFR